MASGKSKNLLGVKQLNWMDPLNTMHNPNAGKNSGSKKFNPSQTPSYQGATTMYGNQVTGRTYKDPKLGIVSQYLPSQAEQQTRTQAQSGINNILGSLGQTDPQMSKQYDDMSNAYADQESAAFDRLYQPKLRDLREDTASRFGTLQATPYFDQQAQLENNVRVPALLSIARDATQMRQNLYNTAQNQKLQELQGLGYVLNGNQANFLSNLQNPQQVSNSGNQFNLQNYANQLQNYQFGQSLQQQQNQALLNAIAGVGGIAAKTI